MLGMRNWDLGHSPAQSVVSPAHMCAIKCTYTHMHTHMHPYTQKHPERAKCLCLCLLLESPTISGLVCLVSVHVSVSFSFWFSFGLDEISGVGFGGQVAGLENWRVLEPLDFEI